MCMIDIHYNQTIASVITKFTAGDNMPNNTVQDYTNTNNSKLNDFINTILLSLPFLTTKEIYDIVEKAAKKHIIDENDINCCFANAIKEKIRPKHLNCYKIEEILQSIVNYNILTPKKCFLVFNPIIERLRKELVEKQCSIGNYKEAMRIAELQYQSELLDITPSTQLKKMVMRSKDLFEEEYNKRQNVSYAINEEIINKKQYEIENDNQPKLQQDTETKREHEQKKRDSYRLTVHNRNIKELIHFTRIENVKTILKYGILPRDRQSGVYPKPIINDYERFDRHLNASCLSVSFPNYKMFFKYRYKNENSSWVVLSLSPELLYDLNITEFYFYRQNAAKSDSERCSFEEMFDKKDGNEPANPQAEILAFGIIPSKYIKTIYVKNSNDMQYLHNIISQNISVKIQPYYFSYRKGDYQ